MCKITIFLYKRYTLQPDNLFHALYCAQFLYQLIEFGVVLHVDFEVSAEQSVMAVDIYAAHHYLLLFGDDTRYVVHDSDVIVSDYF